MLHTKYKKSLGKKLREFTAEEKRHYYKLRYHSYSPAQREAHRRRSYEWSNTWEGRVISQAQAHNSAVATNYPDIFAKGNIDNASLLKWVRARRGAECPYCGYENSTHIDHIVPLAKGGTHTFSNIQMICGQCNFAKRDNTEEEFLSWAVRVANKQTEPQLNDFQE